VGDSVNDARDRTEHGAMRGCGSCEALWNREEVAVGCKVGGVDDDVNELFICLGHEATWGWEMALGAMGRARDGCVDEIWADECKGWRVCDEDGVLCACTEGEATWERETCEAMWKREEVAVGCEGRGVDDELDKLFAFSGHDTMRGHETSEVAA
jgi:hypothetical protein